MEHYGEDLAVIHAAGFTAIARAAAAELLPRLAPGSRVRELGCGDGTTARLLSGAGHDVRALHSSPAFIELARVRAPRASFDVGSLVDAALPADCDAVLAVGEVLGYIDPTSGRAADLDRLLVRIAGALRVGGLLLFDLATPRRARAAAGSPIAGFPVGHSAGFRREEQPLRANLGTPVMLLANWAFERAPARIRLGSRA